MTTSNNNLKNKFIRFFFTLLGIITLLLIIPAYYVIRPRLDPTSTAFFGSQITPLTGALPPYVWWDIRTFCDCEVPYAINAAGSPDIPNGPGDEFAAVEAADLTWTLDPPRSVFSFTKQANDATVAPGLINLDGESIISWDNTNPSVLFPRLRDDVQVVPPNGAVGGEGIIVTFGDGIVNTAPDRDIDPVTGLIHAVAGDDRFALVVVDGGNGVANTTKIAASDDIQVVALNAPVGPLGVVIRPGPDGRLNSPPAGDDRLMRVIEDNGDGISTTLVNNLSNPAFTVGCGSATTGFFFEADIVLDDAKYNWGFNVPMNVPAGNVDVENVVLHELGHFLGLNHNSVNKSVMTSPRATSNLVDLDPDDVEGIEFLYSPDIGDAPEPYDTKVHTTIPLGGTLNGITRFLPDNGAIHLYDEPKFEFLGHSSDGECEAKAIDLSDNGVDMPAAFVPGPNPVTVTITFSRIQNRYDGGDPKKLLYLNCWCDWNGDEDWDDAGEKIIDEPGILPSTPPGGWGAVPGKPRALTKTFNITPPAGFVPEFWCRFRLDFGEDVGDIDYDPNNPGNQSIIPGLNQSKGLAQFGEVEDYRVSAERGMRIEPERSPGSALVGNPGESKTTIFVVNARNTIAFLHKFSLTLSYDPDVLTITGASVIHPSFGPFSTVQVNASNIVFEADLPTGDPLTGCNNVFLFGEQGLFDLDYTVHSQVPIHTLSDLNLTGSLFIEAVENNTCVEKELDLDLVGIELQGDVFRVSSSDEVSASIQFSMSDNSTTPENITFQLNDQGGSDINPGAFSITANRDVVGRIPWLEGSEFGNIPAGTNLSQNFFYDEITQSFALLWPLEFSEGSNSLSVIVGDNAGNLTEETFNFVLLAPDCQGTLGGNVLPGSPCDDDKDCTINDVYDSDCLCLGVLQDIDNDGVCDALDPCPQDNPDDSDGDGICNSDDLCPGGDDSADGDGDGVPDFCDPCPLDNPDDQDGDGVCDSNDICIGGDDNQDADDDSFPDGCDCNPNDPDDVNRIVGSPGMNISSGTYEANISIQSQGIVSSTSTVAFRAREEINLLPGFTVEAGAAFSAVIGDCLPGLLEIAVKEEPERIDTTKPAKEGPQLRVAPNPFSHIMSIEYRLPEPGIVRLAVYSFAGGQCVWQQPPRFQEAGTYALSLSADGWPPGVYYLLLRTEKEMAGRKVVLIR